MKYENQAGAELVQDTLGGAARGWWYCYWVLGGAGGVWWPVSRGGSEFVRVGALLGGVWWRVGGGGTEFVRAGEVWWCVGGSGVWKKPKSASCLIHQRFDIVGSRGIGP